MVLLTPHVNPAATKHTENCHESNSIQPYDRLNHVETDIKNGPSLLNLTKNNQIWPTVTSVDEHELNQIESETIKNDHDYL